MWVLVFECVHASSLELEREVGLGGGGLLEAGLGGVIEAVVAQAAGGRRSSGWAYGVSGAGAMTWWAQSRARSRVAVLR